MSAFEGLRSWRDANAQPSAVVWSRDAVRAVLKASACIAAMLLLVVPLLTVEADGRGGGGGGKGGGGGHAGGGGGHGMRSASHGGGFGGHGGFSSRRGGTHFAGRAAGRASSFRAAHIRGARVSRAGIAARSVGGSHVAGRPWTPRAGVTTAGLGGAGNRLATAPARTRDLAPRVFGNRAIANVTLRSQLGPARFHGGFFGSAWPWWWGGLVTGWFGPLFWPYAYYDFFDYVFWPYAYDDFWPYAYDDIYYGIYGPYAYYGPYTGDGRRRRGVNSGRYAATAKGFARRALEVCSNQTPEFTDSIERISEVVEPTDAQRPALEELSAATAQAIDMLKSACPKDLPSTPTGRLAAMESRLQVMLAAVQTMRPALERFYRSLGDEQKARFNAIAPTNDSDAVGKDQRDLAKFCGEQAAGVANLPIDRIAQAVQPTPAQRSVLDELKDASGKAAEGLKADCPTYQVLTFTGRVEAMEKRLSAMLDAVKTVRPALTKFYDSLGDEQKARFNSLRSAPRPVGS